MNQTDLLSLIVPVLPATGRSSRIRLPVPPGSLTTDQSTLLTPSATPCCITWAQLAPGVGSGAFSLFLIEVITVGVQYLPRAANVAYAFESISGVTLPTPSVYDGTATSGLPCCSYTFWPMTLPCL